MKFQTFSTSIIDLCQKTYEPSFSDIFARTASMQTTFSSAIIPLLGGPNLSTVSVEKTSLETMNSSAFLSNPIFSQ